MSRKSSILALWVVLILAVNSLSAIDSEWRIPINWVQQDSIIVDGRVIQVQAEVSFDSLSRQPREKRNLSFTTGLELNHALGVGGRGEDDLWRKWTGDFDRAWMVQVSLSPSKSSLKRYRGGVQLSPSISLGLNRWSIQNVDIEGLPDSLIGFIPHSSLTPIQGVVYERFPIGVETDTLTIPVTRNEWLAPHAMLGLNFHTNAWNGVISIGYIHVSAHQERILFRAPSLTEEPFIFGEDVERMWRPRMELAFSYQFAHSPWSLRFNLQKILGFQQDQWIGVGVRYEFSGL